MKRTYKNIFAGALAVGMMAATMMAAAADTEIKPDSESQEASMTVNYKIANTYTVSIPAAVTLAADGGRVTIGVEHNIAPGQTLTVTAGGNNLDGNGKLTLTRENSGGETRITDVKKENVTFKKGDTVCTCTGKNTKNQDLTLSAPTGSDAAGTYTGTMVFICAVTENNT